MCKAVLQSEMIVLTLLVGL